LHDAGGMLVQQVHLFDQTFDPLGQGIEDVAGGVLGVVVGVVRNLA